MDRLERYRKKLAVFLVLALCLGLAACGNEVPEGAGKYVCVKVTAGGRELEAEELFPDGVSLELGTGGNGLIHMEGQSGRVQWTLRDESLTIQTGEGISYGILSDGVITLDLLGSDTVLTLLAEGAELPEKEASWLEGDWYGCWRVTEARGEYASLSGRWFDCCGSAVSSNSGNLFLTVWDDGGSAEAFMARAELSPGGPDAGGAAEVVAGEFLGAELEPGDWSIDPESAEYENMLRFSGRVESGEGAFCYEIILRPWGQRWEDVETTQPELLPYFYYDWYLPLIDAEQPMPDRMELATR